MQSTYFGNGNLVDAHSAFEKSFAGAVQHGEVYYDPLNGIDKRAEIKLAHIKKAEAQLGLTKAPSIVTTTGGAGTAGNALIPVFVDQEIVDQTRRMTPLVEMIPRRAIRGVTFDFNELSAKGGAVFLFEDAALSPQQDTYDRVSLPVKYAYSVGLVSNPAIAGARGFLDLLQQDIAVKTRAMKELEEETIINGDASTNSEEYTGLISSITTNTTDLSGGNVTLAQIRTEFANVFNNNGETTLCVTDAATHNYIKGLLLDFQRQPAPPAANLPFGIPGAFEFDGVTFIKDRFMPIAASSKRILFLDMRYLMVGVLQDVTFEEKPSNTDGVKFIVKLYSVFANKFEAAQAQIFGIA